MGFQETPTKFPLPGTRRRRGARGVPVRVPVSARSCPPLTSGKKLSIVPAPAPSSQAARKSAQRGVARRQVPGSHACHGAPRGDSSPQSRRAAIPRSPLLLRTFCPPLGPPPSQPQPLSLLPPSSSLLAEVLPGGEQLLAHSSRAGGGRPGAGDPPASLCAPPGALGPNRGLRITSAPTTVSTPTPGAAGSRQRLLSLTPGLRPPRPAPPQNHAFMSMATPTPGPTPPPRSSQPAGVEGLGSNIARPRPFGCLATPIIAPPTAFSGFPHAAPTPSYQPTTPTGCPITPPRAPPSALLVCSGREGPSFPPRPLLNPWLPCASPGSSCHLPRRR